jgi:protein-disulfide isomerase
LSQRTLYLVAVAGALAAAAAAITVSVLGAGSASNSSSSRLHGVAAVNVLLGGIPQRGTQLGSPSAPVTLVEYADVQCPYCAQFAHAVLPTLVRRYVRTGKLRIELQGLTRVGPASYTGLQSVLAAGRQGRLWHMLELLYANQGVENTGWITTDLLRRTAEAAGADPTRVARDATRPVIAATIQKVDAQATIAGVQGTPTFAFGRTGGRLTWLSFTSFTPRSFAEPIDQLLAE